MSALKCILTSAKVLQSVIQSLKKKEDYWRNIDQLGSNNKIDVVKKNLVSLTGKNLVQTIK